MMHEFAHRIPEGRVTRVAVGLGLFAAAGVAARHFFESAPEIHTRRSESPTPRVESVTEYSNSGDRVEVVLFSDSRSKPKVVPDPQILREKGII